MPREVIVARPIPTILPSAIVSPIFDSDEAADRIEGGMEVWVEIDSTAKLCEWEPIARIRVKEDAHAWYKRRVSTAFLGSSLSEHLFSRELDNVWTLLGYLAANPDLDEPLCTLKPAILGATGYIAYWDRSPLGKSRLKLIDVAGAWFRSSPAFGKAHAILSQPAVG